MHRIGISLAVAGQLALGAPPALAAAHAPGGHSEIGIFSGVQLRLPLGGARAEAPRASLGIAPIARSERSDGAIRTRIGEGLAFRLQPNRPAELMLAGTRLDRLGFRRDGHAPEGPSAGVSTLGWIAIGVAATAVVVVGAAALCLSDSDCVPSE